MTHLLLPVYRSTTSLLTRSLILLTFSQTFTTYNMSKAVYLPLNALRQNDIQSMISIALPILMDGDAKRRYDYHHSRRAMLHFLRAIKLNKNERLLKFIEEYRPNLDWSKVDETYDKLMKVIEPYSQQYGISKNYEYWELDKASARGGPKQSKEYISKYRKNGFEPQELKLYWNYQEIVDLSQDGHFNPVTDQDSHDALISSPVNQRKNNGIIEFIRSGIEEAVFMVPHDKQVIVLDFADERMPGGYFLENARTQEEVILYNSDGYRALLDLKYRVMAGGYILPEFGNVYIKNVRFFQDGSSERLTDLIVAACYDMSGIGEGLYTPPSRNLREDLYERTREKLRTVVASAVANTKGNGENTYLLLGPIGTGAFGNSIEMIGGIFSEILNNPFMNSDKAIRYAFDRIWFVSIDDLGDFDAQFPKNASVTDRENMH